MNTKKFIYIVGFLTVFGFLFYLNIPTVKAEAAEPITMEQLQASIVNLQQQVAYLSQEVSEAQGQINSSDAQEATLAENPPAGALSIDDLGNLLTNISSDVLRLSDKVRQLID